MKRFFSRFLCRLGWHDWKEVPGEWEEDFPGCKSFTNAWCQRCSARADICWMPEEKAREILKENFPELYEAVYGSRRE